MNINELDSYNLGDAVKFNDRLNPRIWGADERMRPEVREQLLKIADDFREFLGIDVEVQDITVSGSNAAYTYTPHSDIDLHLVVDLPEADRNEVYRELFDAKKYAYNDRHDIRIGGHEVELYVQNANKKHHSQGIYSLVNDDWISVPKRRRPDVDDISVKSKFEDLGHRIETAVATGDYEQISALAQRIKDLRQAGLDAHGEFGPENLAFKMLRTQGLIEKLYAARNAAKDRLLSLDERKKKRKKKVKYGYGGYWYPGYAYAGQDHPAGSEGGDGGGDGGGESVKEDVSMTWDGVSPTTDMFTSEDATMTWDGVNPSTAMFTTETQDKKEEDILREFIKFCVSELGIQDMPGVKLRRDPEWPKRNKTFGRYNDMAKTLEVAWGQRHIMDVLRTVAHELTHKHQHEREQVPADAGETGSEYENEANAQAGILMRDWARLHPDHFDHGQVQDLEEAASGYIPTRAQARDPRFSMALTVDIKPGQVGKEANKLKLKTDRQGHPQIARANGLFEALMAEYKALKEDDLDEVKMSPGALEKFATSDAAKGIRAGFEAELIFRDTQGESDEMDPEPDYDADERAYSIQQVIEFFENDEYGYGISDRERNRLEEQLDETYMNWYDEQMMSDFRNEAEDLVREQHLDEMPIGERILAVLTDGMGLTDEQADQILRLGTEAPRFTKSSEQDAFVEQNPDYKIYLEAADDADAILDEEVEQSIEKQDGYYDQAIDNFRDNYSPDDSGFFSDVGLRWMSDIANEFNLDWPVWNMDSRGNEGSRDWDEIGASLQQVVGMPVKVSTGYHSTARREGTWIIEPDGSLDPDDKSEEVGLEIVSPPMPLLTTIEKLKAVVDWANDPNGGNAYTNSSTGLHMGVSLPRIQAEDADKDAGIDYVKLILFLGDKYVLQQFGRTANTYTASAFDKLKQNIKGGRSDPAGVVELLRHGLTELAYRELQKGVGTSKYTSAHLQPGYVEFRSPGGDWLAKSDEEIGILENTMLRFARAMAIAGDPSAERQEYAKKLYKLVTADNEQYADQLRLFSEFSAGTINKEQLKKQWADTVLQKELPSTGKEEYEVYRRDRKDSPDAVVGTLYAKDYDSAYDLFLRQYGKDINELDVRLKQPWFDVFDDQGKILLTLRASDIDKAQQRVEYEYGERSKAWRVYRRPDNTPEPKVSPRAQVAKRIATKPKTPTEYNYEVVDRKTGQVVDRFYAERESTAGAIYNRWLQIKNLPTDTEDYGYRKSAAKPAEAEPDVAQNFSAGRENYELYQHDDPNRIIHRMPFATADEVRAWIDQQEREGMPPGFLRARIPESIDENFADGKVKGKSRPGRVKRAGASCAGSVTDLRARAKKYGGEKGKMYHWCANMKSGRSKKK